MIVLNCEIVDPDKEAAPIYRESYPLVENVLNKKTSWFGNVLCMKLITKLPCLFKLSVNT